MIYYIILFLILLLGIFFPKKQYCILVSVILVLFAGLRANIIGPDTSMYKYIFEDISGHSFTTAWSMYENSGSSEIGKVEVGYWFLNYLFSIFTNYNVFKFFCSLIAVIPACIIIYKYSQNVSLSLFNFFTLHVYTMMSMSMMRQGLAFGISLIAIMFLMEKKTMLFFICVTIACLFHISAVFIFPIYILYNLPYKKKYILGIIIAILFVFIFNSIIFKFLTQYSRISYEAGEAGGTGMLAYISLLLMCSLFIKEQYFHNRLNSFLLYLLAYTIMLWVIGMNLAAIFRLAAYSEFFICLYITNVITKIQNKSLRNVTLICAMLLSFMVMQQVVMREREFFGYYPYFFLWEK